MPSRVGDEWAYYFFAVGGYARVGELARETGDVKRSEWPAVGAHGCATLYARRRHTAPLKLHAREVSAHAPLRRPLLKLRDALRKRLDAERALFGRNLAACRIAKLRS